MSDVLTCHNLHKSYFQGESRLDILVGIDLTIRPGQTVSIMGSSGSGKSTLLHILAGLDKPTSGEIILIGRSLEQLNDNQICQLRNANLGFIYQFHHLLPEFTALENTLMPLTINGKVTQDKHNLALDILGILGLTKRINHFPSQLSGGERQRVAIARAVINNPQLVFADEPTGNLDNSTGSQVLEIFFKLQQEFKTSLIIVTHDKDVAVMTEMHYRLHNGKLSLIEI